MKPYYVDDAVTIFHGDCRDVLPSLNADLVLTDPPFMVRRDNWDTFASAEAFQVFTTEWLRRSNNGSHHLISFFTAEFLPILRASAIAAEWPYRRTLIWSKPAGSQFGGARRDGFWFDFELITVFGDTAVKGSGGTQLSVLSYRTEVDGVHPCKKPQALMCRLVEAYSALGEIVIDPFMGSGTTLRAAKDLGRKAIGIEIDERYCEAAAKRMSQAVLQFGRTG